MKDDPQAGRYVAVPVTLARNPEISAQAKGLYACLASYEGEHGVFPSQQSLADCMGASLDSVQRWLSELEKAKAIRKIDRKVGNLISGKAYDLLATKAMYAAKSASAHVSIGHRTSAASDTASLRLPDTAQVRHELPDTYLPQLELQTPVVPKGTGAAGADSLIAAWRRLCPDSPQPKGEVGSAAYKAAAAAWKREPDLALWESRFCKVPLSDLLSGRAKSWRADFLWVTKPLNVEKIDAGNYDNRQPRNGPGPGMMRTPAGWMPEPERKYDEPDVLF